MNAISRLFQGDQANAVRSSARIREEVNALPQPVRHNEMETEARQREAQLKNLSGQQLQDGERAVAELDAAAAAYKLKHAHVFAQSEALITELVQVQRRERQAIIENRVQFHLSVERPETMRLIAVGEAARMEGFAQEIATHLLAKAWAMEALAPWTFGFQTIAIEKRAAEIVAELQA
jgi:hypothetical protein